jgi:hypothetical protein
MPGRRRRSTTSSRSTTGTTTRTRSTATRKRATAKASKAPAELPVAGPGERVWVLAVPFRAPAPGAVWHAGLQAHVWVGAELPAELAAYDPPAYSLERFLEDELNPTPRPLPVTPALVPRELQETGAGAVAAHAAAGGRVFLLGDDPGVGKTGTAILAVHEIAAQRPVRTVLVIADRPAAITIPHWARSIAGFGDGGLRWCVTTWDRLGKIAKLRFDVVVADEAHMVRHTTTQRWKHWKAVSGAARVKDAPYVLAATATPAHSPLELPYLAPEFAARHGESIKEWADLAKALDRHGFHVERGRYGWQWTEDADARRADLARLQSWLADADPPATLHRPAPWGPVSVTGTPVLLTPAERASYEAEWSEFRAEMQLARRGRQTARGRAALLRFRQKAGLIRVQATVDWIKAQVEAERQVAVSVEFVETAADPIREALLSAGIPVSGIYGRDRFDVEGERLRVHGDGVDQPARRRAAARRVARLGAAAGGAVPPAALLRHPGTPGHRADAPRRTDLALADRLRGGHRGGAGGPRDGRAAGGQRLDRRRGHLGAPGDRRAPRRRLAARRRPHRRLSPATLRAPC